jgi:hypothetical protein
MNVRTRRRGILKGAGAAFLAAPFLRAIEDPARAAAPPRRIVFFVTPNGTVMDAFWPADGTTYGAILKPLEPLRSKLLVMRGIDMKSASKAPVPPDHQPDLPNALTGRQAPGGQIGGISLDQHIANAVGKNTRFASLEVSVQYNFRYYPLVARAAGQPVQPENSATKVFDRVFANLAVGTANTMQATPVDPALERLRAERLSVLDTIKADLADVRCRLGREDARTFDAHLESVRELERSFTFTQGAGGPPAACAKPAAPRSTDFPSAGKAHMDLIAAALACDATRVVTMMWSGGASGVSHTWAGAPASHHGISHGNGSDGVTAGSEQRKQWLTQIETWYAQQFHYLASKLAAIPEGGGSVLDNTALLWVHEQSDGYSHSRRDMPYVLAGSCGGQFRLGRFVRHGGAAHNGLLVALANAMGVPTETFGDPAYGSGPLADLV